MKKDFILPILALAMICLFMSGALAAGNSLTRPVIEKAAEERAEAARREIIPQADEFFLIGAEGLPQTVTEVYGTSNGVGYIFMVTTPPGYGGEIKLIFALSPEGKIIQSSVLEHNETPGFGDKAFAAANECEEKGISFDGVAGATRTSNAYKRGIADVYEAFDLLLKGGAGEWISEF